MDEAIAQFLEITKTESPEIAQYYLEVSNGNLQAAIEMVFEDGGAQSSTDVESGSCRLDLDCSELTVLEWNIQGLLDDFIKERTIAILEIIKQNKPAIIMMQEVTIPIFSYLKSALKSDYNGYSAGELRRDAVIPYFTSIFVSKSKFSTFSAKVTPFRRSEQGRDLLVIDGKYGSHELAILTSHVESLKTGETERKRQLAEIYQVMVGFESTKSVIFGGDTNLKDAEFNSVVQSGKFDVAKVNDVWNMLGTPQEVRYSWDLQKNDNQVKGGKARLRYERMYIRLGAKDRHFVPKSMRFIGTERLPCGLFPSDHWGILATFAL